MASESINNIENNARKLSSSEIEDGKQMEVFNKAQNQLLNIQAERKNNIQQARLQLMSEEQNNRNISQLSEIVTQQSRPVVVRQPGINPHTQAILNKYGYGKTGTITTRSQSKQVTPQNIVINNNTENKTTNNVSVPPQSPAPIVQSQSSDNSGKFKAWLNNEFSRQKEQASIREREFNRREWSLSRSTSKLMDFMGDVGKSISENLNPKRIGSIFNTEMKSISFILGLQYLAVNWKKLLKGVNKVEGWLRSTAKYFGIGEKGGVVNSDFVKSVKVFLGGNTEQSLVDVFGGLFSSGIDLLMKRLELFFKLRGEAVKAVKFPTINSTEPLELIKQLGLYLGDILSVLVGGKDSLLKSVSNSLSRESVNHYIKEGKWQNKDAFSETKGFNDNTSYGDAVISLGARKQNYLSEKDLNSDGTLSNNGVSTIKQSYAIGSMLSDTKSVSSNSLGIIGGFYRLNESVNRTGSALVPLDFFNTQLSPLGIDFNDISKNIKKRRFKYVSVPKEIADEIYEGANVPHEAITAAVNQGIKNETGVSTIDTVSRVGAGALAGATIGSFVPIIGTGIGAGVGAAAGLVADYILKNPFVQGLIASGNAKVKKGLSKDNKLILVPEEAPGEAEEVPVYSDKWENKKEKIFEFYELSPEDMNKIKGKIGEKLNLKDKFEFGFDNAESVKAFDKYITSVRKKVLEDASKDKSIDSYTRNYISSNLENFKSDLDYEKHYGLFENFSQREKELYDQYERETKDNQFKKALDNTANAANNALNAVNEFFSGDAAANEEGDEGLGSDRNISSITRDEVSKINVPTELKKTSAMVGKRLVDYMKSFMGKLKYSQVGPRDPKEGSADCSSTVRHAMIDIAGIDPGKYTEAQIINPSGVMVDGGDVDLDGNGVGVPNESNLQPGDLMFFKSPKKNNRFYGVGHVEMYIGDGLMIGHGSGNGPKIHRVGKDFKNRYIMSKRFVDIAYPNSVEINNTSDQKDYVSDFYSFKNSLNSSQSTPYTFNYNYDSKQASFNKNYPNTSTTYSMPPIAENKNSAVFEDISNLNIGLKSQGDRLLLLADSIYTLTEAVSLKGNNYYVNNTSSVKTSSSMTSLNNNNSNILN